MKNPHLISDGNWKTLSMKEAPVTKKFKRKSREPVKRVSEVKSSKHDSKLDEDSNGEPMDNTFVINTQQRLQAIASVVSGGGDHIGQLGISDTALDMRINTLPATSGKVSATQSSQSRSEITANNKDTFQASFPQVVGYDSQQVYTPREQSLQSRLVLCQQPRADMERERERSLSSSVASQASYMNNNEPPSESPRKRLGEASSGVVTEIKAIQQTRRLLANARERTRVHTISAAFEALRKQVPCYSYGQKLSKLAILRIACNYILSLAQLAELDYTPDHSNLSFRDCVEQCTRTLQAEGRSKKRKE
ncbi:transcription factor atoh8 isoform X2 [Engraulis encrasicolus]|uniref:transcription factor atoh8 isoform X2 n=1 Tax=Engraulis encrasicolus TaxID=184585 RepID=UPI002FCF2962